MEKSGSLECRSLIDRCPVYFFFNPFNLVNG